MIKIAGDDSPFGADSTFFRISDRPKSPLQAESWMTPPLVVWKVRPFLPRGAVVGRR